MRVVQDVNNTCHECGIYSKWYIMFDLEKDIPMEYRIKLLVCLDCLNLAASQLVNDK